MAYVKSNKNSEANAILMKELGRIMTNRREDFVYTLKYSDINVPEKASDIDLINIFVENIHSNKRLMMGTAFLISDNNKMAGFDGEEYTSSICADAVHKSLNRFFDSKQNPVYSNFEGEEEMSNFEGDAENLFYSHDGDSFQFRSERKPRRIDQTKTLHKQRMNAKQSLIEGVVDVKKKEADILAEKEKKKKIQLIVASSVIGAVIFGVSIYAIMKLKKG